MLLGGDDGSVQVWDLTVEDDALAVGWAVNDSGLFLARSPDGTLLAQGAVNGEVWLWDAPSGRRLTTFKGHRDEVGTHGHRR